MQQSIQIQKELVVTPFIQAINRDEKFIGGSLKQAGVRKREIEISQVFGPF